MWQDGERARQTRSRDECFHLPATPLSRAAAMRSTAKVSERLAKAVHLTTNRIAYQLTAERSEGGIGIGLLTYSAHDSLDDRIRLSTMVRRSQRVNSSQGVASVTSAGEQVSGSSWIVDSKQTSSIVGTYMRRSHIGVRLSGQLILSSVLSAHPSYSVQVV